MDGTNVYLLNLYHLKVFVSYQASGKIISHNLINYFE